jgi:predicted phosphodiesterase
VRVAALNDVHGNLPALEAALAEVPDGALIVFGGDVVAGPMPRETWERIEALGDRVRFVRGNADHGGGAAPAGELWERRRRWVFTQLTDEQRGLLEALPPTETIDVDALGPTLFCHGSPRDENEILTAVTSEARLREVLAGVSGRVVVCGHTHHQFDRRVGELRVVNAGSVGMPYEGKRGAFWALLGPDVELRRTDYDVDAAAEAMRASGYPDPDEDLLPSLLEPPSADEVAAFFEQSALEQARS